MNHRVLLAMVMTLAAEAVLAQELSPEQKLARRRSPVVEVFEQVRDSVVNISSTSIVTVRESPFGFDQFFEEMFDFPSSRTRRFRSTSVGSGFVIHRDGYIVTNAHVVARTTEREVTLADESRYHARIVALDMQHDLATLKIEAHKPLPALRLGESRDLMPGETVIAVGNPLGYQHTVTAGIISAVNREIRFSEDVAYTNIIQTDAAINPGNSGGPLLNVNGKLIGITTAIRGDAQNVGFAIPVNALRELLPSLLNFERLNEVVFGAPIRRMGGLPPGEGGKAMNGARVDDVQPGSPAAKAGLHQGDVILSVDGEPVRTLADWYVHMLAHRAGDQVLLRVGHAEGKVREVAVRLDQRPEPDGLRLAKRRLGLELKPVPPELLQSLGLSEDVGLLVVGVEPRSPADRVAVRRGDILRLLGRHSVNSIDTLGGILEEVEPGEALLIGVLRGDGYRLSMAHGRIIVR